MTIWLLLIFAALSAAQNASFSRPVIASRSGLDPFWHEIMIPVVLCLAVILLIVSIFAVALITVKSMQDTDSCLVSFVPPGFDSIWEHNVKAELEMSHDWSKSSLHDQTNSPIEIITVFPDANYSTSKLIKDDNSLLMPTPLIANNFAKCPIGQK